MRLEFNLLYGDLVVGRIHEAFCADDTWYGQFESVIRREQGDLSRRLLDYVQFCEQWNERAGNGLAADLGEFERYRDVIDSGFWLLKTGSGKVSQIEHAPIFFLGGDISWREMPKTPVASVAQPLD